MSYNENILIIDQNILIIDQNSTLCFTSWHWTKNGLFLFFAVKLEQENFSEMVVSHYKMLWWFVGGHNRNLQFTIYNTLLINPSANPTTHPPTQANYVIHTFMCFLIIIQPSSHATTHIGNSPSIRYFLDCFWTKVMPWNSEYQRKISSQGEVAWGKQ